MSADGGRTALDLLVERTAHRPGDEVVLLVDSTTARRGTVVVSHLGRAVGEVAVDLAPGRGRVPLGRYAPGSYAVRLTAADGPTAATAFDVLVDPGERPRYGFLADFGPGRDDAEALADSLRAYHLTAVQLYDWMYRHARLLPPADLPDEFADALGRRLSLTTVRTLTALVQRLGARAVAYAAVYGAGEEYARDHPDEVLHHRDGRPWQLADFLWVMDVSEGSTWSAHVVAEMAGAVREMGFDGLHLDQYGDPKVALTSSGEVVDLAEGFVSLIGAVRHALPTSTLIFNNVNDFPSSVTVHAPQDATYVEVWPPHDAYADLVRLVDAARAVDRRRPVILAAYLEPFATAGGPAEVAAAALALSVVWAAGGQYLLLGERRGVLVDPYYPRFATLTDEAVDRLRRFADFAVANGDVLTAPAVRPATRSLWRGVNEDVVVDGAPATAEPEAGSVWVRLATDGTRLVVNLVDLRHQADARWNAARTPTEPLAGVRLRVRVASARPRARWGHPAAGPELRPLPGRLDGEHLELEVPTLDTWAVVVVER